MSSNVELLPSAERSEAVRRMFSSIAGRYDRANTLLSGGVHHLWRRSAVQALALPPDARVLDACCGTGDLSIALATRPSARGEVVGTDFCEEMVQIARQKAGRHPSAAPLRFQTADLLSLPFAERSFDAATVSFGIRNVVDPAAGVKEMARVLKPGGQLLVLEFGQPDGPLFGPLFRAWSRWGIPLLGGLVTGHREPYEYLPRTSRAFPAGRAFVGEVLERAGVRPRVVRPLTFGIAWLYVGEVP